MPYFNKFINLYTLELSLICPYRRHPVDTVQFTAFFIPIFFIHLVRDLPKDHQLVVFLRGFSLSSLSIAHQICH